jgi:S1-C subfamily serine protease
MKERNVIALVIVSLMLGALMWAGISYLIYRPQISSLNSGVSDLENLVEGIEGDVSELKGKIEELSRESETMESIGLGVDGINERLESLETENQQTKNSLDSGLNQINTRLDGIETGVQNEETIIDAYDSISPSVVFITSTVLTFDFQLQVDVPSQGVGSGVVVSPEGYILTNNHVVEDAEFITVSFRPGEEIEAVLVGTDASTDLAVIKIDPSPDLPVAVLGDSDKVRAGMTAIAIGNPFSLERTVTVGVVSSVNRTINAETGDIIFGVIQTDASVNPGNSGGPLVNSKGVVIGINSAIISPVQGSVGIGFAIPINTAKRIMTQLIETGRVSRPYLGITGTSVSELPSELNLPSAGVLIIDVFIGSPVDKVGLRGSDTEVRLGSLIYPIGGDVIIKIDEVEVNTIEDLLEFLSEAEVGEAVRIGYHRDGLEGSVNVLLEERPS